MANPNTAGQQVSNLQNPVSNLQIHHSLAPSTLPAPILGPKQGCGQHLYASARLGISFYDGRYRSRSECENRLTQRGIPVRLKTVRDAKKEWGLYGDQLMRQRQFICEYAGDLLTTKEARRQQQIYDELASTCRIASALLVVREHLPSGKACLRTNIDAIRVGNVAQFINHSCDGVNLSSILVRSSESLLPCQHFFASKDIKEGEELTFSYGQIQVRFKGLPCFCGSFSCLGILPAEHT